MDNREVTSSGYILQCQMKHTEGGRSSIEYATYEVEHDFAEQHVLEGSERFWIVLCAEVLKCLVEVGICSCVIFVLSMQDTGLEVKSRLEMWWAVYRVGGCSRGSECCLYNV